ncbi:MAG: hypothetical protein MUO76_03345 [Anaerolineaceae bacterium]|nr:hypothetical protein [Anaerolineaceae bacterium]
MVDILGEIWGQPAYLAALDAGRVDIALHRLYITAPTERTIDHFIYLVASPPDEGIDYQQTIDLIKYWHVREAIPYLRTNLYTRELDNILLRTYSAETLDYFGALSEDDFPVLMELFEEFSTFSTEDLEMMIASLNGPPPFTRIASIIGRTQPSDLIFQYLPPFLYPAQNFTTRYAAVHVLHETGDEGLTHIVPLLSDKSIEMQTLVEDALNKGPVVIPLLLDFIEENDYQPGDQAAFRVLSNVSAQDFGEDVTQWCSWWEDVENQIASITEPSQFLEALESPERLIRYAVLEKIIEAGPEAVDTLPKLAQMIEGMDDLWRLAIRALGAIGEEALPTLIPLISSEDLSAVSWMVLLELEAMGPESISAVPALIDELARQHPKGHERYGSYGSYRDQHLVYVLNQITGERFGIDVDAWRSWWEAR